MKTTKFNINICSVQILQELPSLQSCPFKMADVTGGSIFITNIDVKRRTQITLNILLCYDQI